MVVVVGVASQPDRDLPVVFGVGSRGVLVVVVGGKKRGAPRVWGPSFGSGWRRCPTLPHPGECSTIGVSRLSFRVRNGTGRFPGAMTTATIIGLLSCSAGNTRGFPGLVLGNRRVDARDSVYSTWVLALSEAGNGCVVGGWPLVPVSSKNYFSSTSGLSTR